MLGFYIFLTRYIFSLFGLSASNQAFQSIRKFIVILFFLSFIPESLSYSQCKTFLFNHINVRNGLSDQVVTCITQDSSGLVWIGTVNGLNRYDGYQFKIFRHDVYNNTTISNNSIKDLLVDKFGNLWIATADGLNKFNFDTEDFTNFSFSPADSFLQITRNTQCIAEDNDGVIWLGTIGSGLIAFNPVNQKFIQFKHKKNDDFGIPDNTISDIIIDKKGTLWIGTSNGLSILETIEKKKLWKPSSRLIFNNYYHTDRKSSLASSRINCLFQDSKKDVWIGTPNGLSQLTPGNRNLMWFINYYHQNNDPEILPKNYIWTIFEDSRKQLWIGTEEGLALAVPSQQKEKPKFCYYLQDLTNSQALHNSTIRTIFEDKSGLLFMGTYGGINTLNLKQKKFINYSSFSDKKNKLEVKDVYEDNNNTLWIASWHGLISYDKRKESNTLYETNPSDPSSISNNHVWTVIGDNKGSIWAGTSEGLNRLNLATGKFTRYKHDTSNNHSISNNLVNCLTIDRKNRIWAGTNYGISVMDINADNPNFKNYIPVISPKLPSENFIYNIFEDIYGTMWLATGSGLYAFNPDSGTFTSYRHKPNDRNSLISDNVSCVTEFPEKTLWIGTDEGMDKLDLNTNQIEHYVTKDGLPNNQIRAILRDNSLNLWISTAKGLSKFNIPNGIFTNFFENDGIESSIFSAGARKTKHGEMLFANYKGILGFYPDSIYLNDYIPNIVITNFLLYNQPVNVGQQVGGRTILQKAINQTQTLILSYKDYVFTFEFAALSFLNPEYNKYSYRMDGFDVGWQQTTADRRFATYTNLNPGKYIFQVKGSNNDGVWNNKGTSLNIIITPPYYKTLWFKICAVLLIILSVLSIYYVKIRSVQAQQILLQAKVEERTRELMQVNEKLKTQHKEIHEQKEILEKQKDKISLVNKSLEEFSYVVSHDLKAPLRGIRQLSHWLAQDFYESLDEDGREIIRLLTRRVDKMSRLIEGILQYSRVGKKPLQIQEIDINKLLKDTIEMIAPPESIKIEIKQSLPILKADATQMEQVFLNLISNAVKFIDKPKGEIKINCVNKKDVYEFSISDNGIGIERKYYDKIFGVFQTLNQQRESSNTGIGLTIVKKIIEMWGGKIWLQSTPGQGSTFFFAIPRKIKNS